MAMPPSNRVLPALVVVALSYGCQRLEADDAAPDHSEPVVARAHARPSTPRPRAISLRCGFAVALPFRRAPAPTPSGMLDQIATENRFRKVALTASCADLDTITSTADLFEVTSRGMLHHIGATVDARKAIELQGRRGLEVQAHVPADKPIAGLGWTGALDVRLRMFRSGLRLYQLLVLQAAHNGDADAVATTFFDSFELSNDAPPPTPAPKWARHSIGPFTVEAPGKAVVQNRHQPLDGDEVRFVHEDGPTGYSMRIWNNALPSRSHTAHERLEAFFALTFATEHSEVVSQVRVTLGEWPALDVDYHQNLPMPDSIAADDPKTREAVAEFIKDKKPGDHLRLVMVGDTVVELRVRMDRRQDRLGRFMGSLQRAPE